MYVYIYTAIIFICSARSHILRGINEPHSYRTAMQNPLYIYVYVLIYGSYVLCSVVVVCSEAFIRRIYVLVQCRASGRVRTLVQYRLPALAISAASGHMVGTSVQSCGFTCVSGSMQAIVERAALKVKGHREWVALKVNVEISSDISALLLMPYYKLGAVYSARLCYYCFL